MKHIIIVLLILMLTGCKNKRGEENFTGRNTILSLSEMAENAECVDLTDSISFICLSDSCQDALFKGINKCMIHKDWIYILDYFGTSTLTVFNMDGDFLFKVGSQGNGMGEYHKITDFDVHDDKIYLLDSQLRKIFVYHGDGRFMKEYSYNGKLEGVNGMVVLSNGDFLFGMDVELNPSVQVVQSDSDFNLKRTILSFDDMTTRKHLNIGSFRRCGNKIVYYYPVSDHIYHFDNLGHIVHRYDISIGNPIPDDIKTDYELLAKRKREGQLFSYFYETPLMNRNLLAATVFSNSNKAMLFLSLDSPSFALKEYKKESISFSLSDFNFPVYMDDDAVYCNLDGMVYEYLDADSQTKIDERTKEFLSEGGNVLVVYHLKNTDAKLM